MTDAGFVTHGVRVAWRLVIEFMCGMGFAALLRAGFRAGKLRITPS